MTNWGRCEQLTEAVERLIREDEGLANLRGVTILCDSRDDRPKETNTEYERHWQVDKVTGQKAHRIRGGQGGEPLFLASVPEWTLSHFDAPTFEKMVHEMLCSIEVGRNEETGEKVLKKIGPDARFWTKNLQKYGMWHDRQRAAVRAAMSQSQLRLQLEEELDEEAAVAAMPEPEPSEAEGEYAPTAEERAELQAAAAAEQPEPEAPKRSRRRNVPAETLRDGFTVPPVVS